ncbi:GNAT family N-acetyltransferase [Mesorhizobium sp. M7D.F.Ca.US.005.01.1.1]|uniref:GNAT family N-acetyltransferase n=1 Tax=Mesorhizobium sp. M7D.F.Ca.US.005.01.1.1 TaxID=2493678 RepID=UPI000F75D190|nr:GNAT family N-acetyltransferase [Mesorhizobium sp. M7D.F.Ca.US.005.01.1.1]AZO43753.1 GNAT family N-acetyltransferase [Mesorhizobium sp. M7D.F.Ca.US.005.01.1.1]
MSAGDDDLNWRIEQACREGWPAAAETVVDGWLLRRSGGRIRRTNSANPLRGKRGAPDAVIDAAESFYIGHGQTPLFRVPDIAGELEAVLDYRGYQPEGGTIHLHAGIGDLAEVRDEQVTVSKVPDEDWLAARFHMGAFDDAERRIFREMTGLILGDRAFVSCERDSEIAALAYGVIRNGLLVVESVETDGRFRQQGLGRKTVGGLIDWARRAGASGACLQVVADNAPARALYASLGFSRELYRYHYRRKPHEPR